MRRIIARSKRPRVEAAHYSPTKRPHKTTAENIKKRTRTHTRQKESHLGKARRKPKSNKNEKKKGNKHGMEDSAKEKPQVRSGTLEHHNTTHHTDSREQQQTETN